MTPIATLIRHRAAIVAACRLCLISDEAAEVAEAMNALAAPDEARLLESGQVFSAAEGDG